MNTLRTLVLIAIGGFMFSCAKENLTDSDFRIDPKSMPELALRAFLFTSDSIQFTEAVLPGPDTVDAMSREITIPDSVINVQIGESVSISVNIKNRPSLGNYKIRRLLLSLPNVAAYWSFGANINSTLISEIDLLVPKTIRPSEGLPVLITALLEKDNPKDIKQRIRFFVKPKQIIMNIK